MVVDQLIVMPELPNLPAVHHLRVLEIPIGNQLRLLPEHKIIGVVDDKGERVCQSSVKCPSEQVL